MSWQMESLPVSFAFSSQKCQVCGEKPAKFHFGSISCRACAAFFRRFVNSSKKAPAACSCGAKGISLCRFCRVEKCIAAGMNKCSVRFSREGEKRASKSYFGQEFDLPDLILSKGFEKILQVRNMYNIHRDESEIIKFFTESPRKITAREWSAIWGNQYQILGRMSMNAFPELQELSILERKVLLNNFLPKWLGFNSSMIRIRSLQENVTFAIPTPDVFYEREYCSDSAVCLKSIFMPYWTSFAVNLFKPLLDAQLDEMEFIALMALLLLDPAYPNLTPKSSELCQNLRKVVQKQLILYHQENKKPIGRLVDVLNILRCVERFEGKLYEEILLCELNGIAMDHDFLRIVNSSRM